MDPAVFGYIRVSQAEGESGLVTQRRILHDHGLRDDRIFADMASGRSMRRPEWRRLRGILRPGDAVAVPRLDRLARNLSEGLRAVEDLHSQGISIAPSMRAWTPATTAPLPGSCSICCSPWPSGRGRPSGVGSRPAWTAPRPRAGSGADPRRCCRRSCGPCGPSWRAVGR